VLEARGVPQAIVDAMDAANRRSEALGKEFGA
jgi:hypothetical protein